MKAVLGPFVLRRLKTEVASQLTAKQQHEEMVTMTAEQAALYQEAVHQLHSEVANHDSGDLASPPAWPPLTQHVLCMYTHCYTLTLSYTAYVILHATAIEECAGNESRTV